MNLVRFKMLQKMVGEDEKLTYKSKVDLARLPPYRNSLIQHIHRANHRLTGHRRANETTFDRPKPYQSGQGWQKTEAGVLELLWSTCPILPTKMIDFVAANYVKDHTGIIDIEDEEYAIDIEMEDMIHDDNDE